VAVVGGKTIHRVPVSSVSPFIKPYRGYKYVFEGDDGSPPTAPKDIDPLPTSLDHHSPASEIMVALFIDGRRLCNL
jgi:hypothetical protein